MSSHVMRNMRIYMSIPTCIINISWCITEADCNGETHFDICDFVTYVSSMRNTSYAENILFRATQIQPNHFAQVIKLKCKFTAVLQLLHGITTVVPEQKWCGNSTQDSWNIVCRKWFMPWSFPRSQKTLIDMRSFQCRNPHYRTHITAVLPSYWAFL